MSFLIIVTALSTANQRSHYWHRDNTLTKTVSDCTGTRTGMQQTVLMAASIDQ